MHRTCRLGPAQREGRRLIAGLKSGPHRFDPESGAVRGDWRGRVDLPDEPPQRCRHRSHRADLVRHDGQLEARPTRAVSIRCDGGAVRRHRRPARVAITNGPALNADAASLYHIDTSARRSSTRIHVHDDGIAGTGRSPSDVKPRKAPMGYPDGATCRCRRRRVDWASMAAGACGATIRARQHADSDGRLPGRQRHQDALGGPDVKQLMPRPHAGSLAAATGGCSPMLATSSPSPLRSRALPLTACATHRVATRPKKNRQGKTDTGQESRPRKGSSECEGQERAISRLIAARRGRRHDRRLHVRL